MAGIAHADHGGCEPESQEKEMSESPQISADKFGASALVRGAELLYVVVGGRRFDALPPRARLNLNNSGCWMGFA